MVEREACFKFLDTNISQDLTWSHLYFLRTLKRANVSQQLLLSFYRCSVESILCHDILVWFTSCTEADNKALQRVIKTDQKNHPHITTTHHPV